MEWTFDPLEIKNAFLNIHKLGAVVCSYRVNFYGVSSSRLQGGLPTDRLVAEWHLDSPRVVDILKGSRKAYTIEERIEFRPPSTSGRPRNEIGNAPSPFSWRTAGSFNRHLPRVWP